MLIHFKKFFHVVQLCWCSLCPFRPIVSLQSCLFSCNCSQADLHWQSTNQFTMKDSFIFVDWAKSHKDKETICSFDVCSLFTNVPLDETIQICLTKSYSLSDPPTLPRTVLKDLLGFATKKSHFTYDQIDGVAMGCPLGPVLANIFMCHFEESWLTNNQFRPSICFHFLLIWQ